MSARLAILLILGAMVAGLLVLQTLAHEFFLYWRFWWFDNLLHFIGGFVIGGLALWYLMFEVPERFKKTTMRVAISLAAFLVAAALWETFEYVVGAPRESAYVADIVSDTIMGIFGTFLAQILFIRHGR